MPQMLDPLDARCRYQNEPYAHAAYIPIALPNGVAFALLQKKKKKQPPRKQKEDQDHWPTREPFPFP